MKESEKPTIEGKKETKINKRKIIAISTAAFLLPLSISVAAVAYLSNLLIKAKRSESKTTPGKFGIKYKNVVFKSSDGFDVKSWWISGRIKNKAIILCHGFGLDKSDFPGHLKFLYNAGYSLLLFDFRGHGESSLEYTSLGYLEVNDLLGAVSFVRRKKIRRIGILGLSMGASTAIIAATKTKYINAVVADSPFAKLHEVIDNYGKKYYHISSKIITRLTVWMAELRTGFKYERVNPIEDIKKMNAPLLIIHGQKDSLVPVANAKELFANAKGPKEFVVFPGIDHGEAHLKCKFKYENKVLDFYRRYLFCKSKKI